MSTTTHTSRHAHDPLVAAFRSLRHEVVYLLRHQLGSLRARRTRLPGARMNVGCGKYPLPGWINADIAGKSDVVFDIRRRWPFDDNQLDLVRLEHVLEHVEYSSQADHVLTECFRVLRPGGSIRVGVPNTEQAIRAYFEGPESEYFRIARERWHPQSVQLPIEHINFHFRDRFGEHLFAYDVPALEAALARAGFVNICPAGFDADLDRADREAGTIRLSGKKPRAKETQS